MIALQFFLMIENVALCDLSAVPYIFLFLSPIKLTFYASLLNKWRQQSISICSRLGAKAGTDKMINMPKLPTSFMNNFVHMKFIKSYQRQRVCGAFCCLFFPRFIEECVMILHGIVWFIPKIVVVKYNYKENYSNKIKLKSLFVCLNALISGTRFKLKKYFCIG